VQGLIDTTGKAVPFMRRLVLLLLAGFALPGGEVAQAVTFAYVANGSETTVSQYLVGSHGALVPLSPAKVAAGARPTDVAVSPDGRSAYVTDAFSDVVSQYDVGVSGQLVPKTPATVPAGDFPWEVAVSPDGHSLYVVNAVGNSVSQYDVGAGGVLRPKAPASVPSGQFPLDVALSPNGGSAYVSTSRATASPSTRWARLER
jgi:DNA-binding beta-propeller fold protein YncE